jgi:hypothetical protein
MADIMNKIKFLSDVKIPRLTVNDKLLVSGDLQVDGSVITTNYKESIIKDAFVVYNPEKENYFTQLGEVILTGNLNYYSEEDSLLTQDIIKLIRAFSMLFKNTEPGINVKTFDGSVSASVWDSEENTWHDQIGTLELIYTVEDTCTLYDIMVGGATLLTIQKDNNGFSDIPKIVFHGIDIVGLTLDDVEGLNELFDNPSAFVSSGAYGIIYDKEEDSIRLGYGNYDTEGNSKYFNFNEGEGNPLAVRDLRSEDDGSLVMWDAEKYCLVKSPITYRYTENVMGDILISDIYIDDNLNVLGNATFGEETIRLRGNQAEGATLEVFDDDLDECTSITSYDISSGRGYFRDDITAHNYTFEDETYPAIDAQGDIVATGKVTAANAQVNNTMVIGEGVAEGRGSMVVGYGCVTTADAKYAIAAGDTLIATAEGQAVFGKYNTENDEALFIVGDGESDTNRHNAFEVISRDGVVYLKVGETEISEKQLKALMPEPTFFTILNVKFEYTFGMTWSDFINSEYNIDGPIDEPLFKLNEYGDVQFFDTDGHYYTEIADPDTYEAIRSDAFVQNKKYTFL